MRNIADAECCADFGGTRVDFVTSLGLDDGAQPLRSSHDGIGGRTDDGGGTEYIIGRIDEGGGGGMKEEGATEIGDDGSRINVPSSAYCSPWTAGIGARWLSGGRSLHAARSLLGGRGMPNRVWLSKERRAIEFTRTVKLQ